MINYEVLLLKVLLDKDRFNSFKEYIDLKYLKENFRELSFLYQTLLSLHEKTNQSLSVDDLQGAFFASYPESDRTIYGAFFEQLYAANVSEVVAEDIIQGLLRKKQNLKLSELSFAVAQGLKPQEELDNFLSKTSVEAPSDLPDYEVTTDLEELLKGHATEQGLRWRLDCLNKSLGSLRKGDFGFIFARPETGKTTFLASEISHFLTQTKTPIVWLNNEEDGWKVMLRVYCAYFGLSSEQVLSNVKKFKDLFTQATIGSFRFFDSANITRYDVERIVKRLQPGLVIYDQIDKVKGFSSDREDLRLGAIYQWARELAKGSHAAIGVCQADGQAEGVRYLTMEHVANAKTAKQAEADFILGLGKTNDVELGNSRFLNISKNKLLGDKDSISDLRHGRFEVLIEPTIARYKDVIKFD